MSDKSNSPYIVYHVTFNQTRLVDAKGQYHADIKTYDAQKMAKDIGLDLVCFNKPDANQLAFCKIVDFGKWRYEEEKKKKKEAHANKKESKEVRFSAGICDHDIEHKVKQINEFLEEGHEVALTLKVFGRDRDHFDLAEEKMTKIVSMCDCHKGKESGRKREGFSISVKMLPISHK